MKTVVIDGIEYQLVPIPKQDEQNDDQHQNTTGNDAGSILADFLGENDTGVQPLVSEPSTGGEAQIRIVNATGGVQTAQPKEYEYRKKFLNRELTPNDVIGKTGIPQRAVKSFKDVPEIESDKGGKLFYGPGLEFDYTY